MCYILLLLGFIFLIKGADLFVDGSSSFASILRVPSVIVGLTIAAMGTSAPEAAVSITAGLNGNNQIALGNILGSNIFNLLIVAGVCSAIKPFFTDDVILKRDFPVSIGASLIVLLFSADKLISRIEGCILLVLAAAYIILMVISAVKNRAAGENTNALSPIRSIAFIAAGLAAIILGGNLVVDNAAIIAESFGLSQTLIGLTIVAIGTSLPELVTSTVAARKGESGLALGNVVGSNIFNILFILGASSALNPIDVGFESVYDTVFLIIVSALFFSLTFISKKKVPRYLGVLCILIYIFYTVYIIIR